MTLPVNLFQYADAAIIVFIALMLIYGYFKGFLLQIFSILIFIAVVLVSWMIAPILAKALPLMQASEQFNVIPLIGPIFQNTINTIFWFIIIVFGLMVLSFFFKPVLKGIGKIPVVKQVNRVLGLLLGGIKAVVILILVTLLIGSGLFANGKDLIDQSLLGKVSPAAQWAVVSIASRFDSTGFVAKIMTGQEFSEEDVVLFDAWLTSKKVPVEIVPILSKLLRLKPIDSTQMSTLLEWLRENGLSEEDIARFMESFQ
jgi:uncharacterized membrane protein required for colicin V production